MTTPLLDNIKQDFPHAQAEMILLLTQLGLSLERIIVLLEMAHIHLSKDQLYFLR